MHGAELALDLQLPACSASSFSEGTRREMAPAVLLGAFLSSLWEEGAAISNVLPPWCAHLPGEEHCSGFAA